MPAPANGHPISSPLPDSADVVVCGAGIAGIAAAHALALQGAGTVVLIDERAPLTLTSDKSTECYRNWWPGPDGAMLALMNRSIDLLEGVAERSENAIRMGRRGYLYGTHDPARVEAWRFLTRTAESQGMGPVRVHEGRPDDPVYEPAPTEGLPTEPTGCDLILDPALMQRHFPYVDPNMRGVLHVRRCGWFSGQQLGMFLLEEAREHGLVFVQAAMTDVAVKDGRVRGVTVRQGGARHEIATGTLVLAGGPFLDVQAKMLGVSLPVYTECHLKAAFRDTQGALPREAPMVIYEDQQSLTWSDELRGSLAAHPDTRHLTGMLPGGVHARPEGGADSQNVLVLWNVKIDPSPPQYPLPVPPYYQEVTLRGLQAMVPAMAQYQERLPRAVVDGGYYTRTEENRPLIGPLPVEGAYLCGALSGYGLMAACAAGELVAAHIGGGDLPSYAKAFHPARFDDPGYMAPFRAWQGDGQL